MSLKPAPVGNLLAFLSQVPDPRGRQGRRHCLEAMLASIVCAMLQGARGYSAITQWVHDQDVELWHALGFTRRPPKLGAFRSLLMTISPTHFERVLADWARYCLGVSGEEQSLRAVAMDGKTLCGTLQPHERAVHLLASPDQQTVGKLITWRKPLRGAKRTAANRLMQYAAERQDMNRYPTFREKGWQIGSGPTEAECKTTTHRVKGRGRRWNSVNAEAMMALAALHDSRLWNQRWTNLDPQTN